MTNQELIAEARKWNGRIGNPLARGVMTSADLVAAVTAIENALAAFEDATVPVLSEEIRDGLMLALTAAGYDLSGTDHSQPNEIEVGGDDVEFRLTINAL